MKQEKYYRVAARCSEKKEFAAVYVNVKEFISDKERFFVQRIDSGLKLIKPEFADTNNETLVDRVKGGEPKQMIPKSPTKASTTLCIGTYFSETVGLMFERTYYGWLVRVATDRERKNYERYTAKGNVSKAGYFHFTPEQRERLDLKNPETVFLVSVCVDAEKGEYMTLEKINEQDVGLTIRRPDSKKTIFSYVWKPTDYANYLFNLPSIFKSRCVPGVSKLPSYFDENGKFIIEAPNRKCPRCGSYYSAYKTSAYSCPECTEKLSEQAFEELVCRLENSL